jgi:hypothetical protein
VSKIKANGGGDEAEDVNGALLMASSMSFNK